MPAPRRPVPNRRSFLRRAALLAAGAPAAGVLLNACTREERADEADWPANLQIATPDKPVTWDIPTDNRPIADGLGPEKGATLRLFCYDGYIAPGAVRAFENRYGAKVEISTFNNTDDALETIRTERPDYDLYFPSYNQIGRLVTGGLLRPLNHSYIPNINNLWPVFTNPWYDREWRYTVPYTVYTTGIGWRTDQIPADVAKLPNPYAALWDPAHKRQTAVIDDRHTAMAMVLLKLGITDVNTSSPEDLQKVRESLAEMQHNTDPAISVTMFSDLAAGQIGVSQMWSGDIIGAKNYLPEGVGPEVLRYWFPADGRGLVENDLMVLLRGGKSPVLAHLFINLMLDPVAARKNFTAIGYQPPQVSIDPDSLVADGFIPANLQAAIVRPEYFDVGYRILELEPANDDAWQEIWRAFKTRQL